MATFNSFAVVPTVVSGTPLAPVWAAAADLGIVLGVNPTSIAPVWPSAAEPASIVLSNTLIINAIGAEATYNQYSDGYLDGERFGFSSPYEETMEPIQLGETDDAKKTISFEIYTATGLPASGNAGEGPVCLPGASEIQVNRDLTGYVNAAGVFAHIGDGKYRYTYANSEVDAINGEGSSWFRVKVSGFRTIVLQVPIRNLAPTATAVRDAVLNAVRSGFVGTGTIGEGIAIAASLLQGNFFMDNVVNGTNGQTDARIRCFHTGAAAAAATIGGTGQGEFATFIVTTDYVGNNKILTHRVVQQ